MNEDIERLEKEKRETKKKLEQEEKLSKQLYMDKMEGIVSARQYVMLSKNNDETIINLEKNLEKINKEIHKINTGNEKMNIGEIEIMMKKFFKYSLPTNELLNDVIDKIYIDKDRNIEIFFKKNVSKYIQLEKKRGEN